MTDARPRTRPDDKANEHTKTIRTTTLIEGDAVMPRISGIAGVVRPSIGTKKRLRNVRAHERAIAARMEEERQHEEYEAARRVEEESYYASENGSELSRESSTEPVNNEPIAKAPKEEEK